ncbi:MAG: aminoglycoside phosphotransferase family protein [Acidimicrobiia bacterium]
MPPAEVDLDVDLVGAMIRSQRPDLATLDVTELAFGWDNVSYRLGDHWVARFPRRSVAVPLIANEARWLPLLAPRLPLPIPAPVFVGEPGRGYPWPWSIARLIEGESAAETDDLDLDGCATQLGQFLRALHEPAPADAPGNPFRGVPLATRDETTRSRLSLIDDDARRRALETRWHGALVADVHPGPSLWLHGDLHPHNLLVVGGLLSGVVDFGDVTSGDPAVDLAAAWNFVPSAQESLWEAYGRADDALRARVRGWAIALGLAYVANSADNPTMESIGEATLEAVLESE